jgi:hypothetical protein
LKSSHIAKVSLVLIAFGWLHTAAYTQGILVFKGTVKCMITDDEHATRGAKNVIVVPGFMPQKSGMTAEQGYFEVNTGLPLEKLQDKYVELYFVSSCKPCEKKASVFISADQVRTIVRPNGTILSYITVPTIRMNAGCKQTELDPLQSDELLTKIEGRPGEDLGRVSSLNVVTAPPALLNFITSGIALPGVAGAGFFPVDNAPALPGPIQGYGKFLWASPMVLSANAGFNFSPGRDLSEAAFWNPSALAGKPSAVSVFTNFKNNVKLSVFKRLSDRFTLGAGAIYTRQQEYRPTVYPGLPGNDTVSSLRTLQEYAAFLSAAYKINARLSMGLTVKSIWQRFNMPVSLLISETPDFTQYNDTTVKRQRFDADLSVSYAITSALKAGLNFMNLTGTHLYADPFAPPKQTPAQQDIPYRQLRSLGAGLCYGWKQFNIGTDALFTSAGLYDLTFGANWIPFNNALASAGFACKQKSYMLGFKWKQFRISYIDDNGLMASDKNPGRSKFLNGRIFSGAMFNF